MNPILPRQYYIPDVEARPFADGRVYLYGSLDIPGGTSYCSSEYRVFSSDDMTNWTDHGISFTGFASGPHRAAVPGVLYAPDCERIGDRYCLFYCQSCGEEGVAFADSPAGPFEGATPIAGADRTQIDPAVLVDDDGQVYYFWGQVSAKGGRLNKEMTGLVEGSIVEGMLTEAQHGFHEGISVRKIGGIYYLLYTDISRGRATCLSYATSNKPLGPYTKRGIVIDNTGCDPESWNNHGSMAQVNGQWYVFYHRSTHNSRFSRRICVEPIAIADDGSIAEVEMTTQGASAPLDPFLMLAAADACLLHGAVYIDSLSTHEGHQEFLNQAHHGDWAAYKYLDFGGCETKVCIWASSASYGGQIDVRLDAPDGQRVASVHMDRTGGWNAFAPFVAPLEVKVEGKRAVYLCFSGGEGRLMSLQSLQFL